MSKIYTTTEHLTFGETIRKLREDRRLPIRIIAEKLNIDLSLYSKIERGERKARKEQVIQFAKLYKTNKDELLTLWLADQVVEVVQNEDVALKAMLVAEGQVKYHQK